MEEKEKVPKRQLRLWLCMLYTDNDKHNLMIEMLRRSYHEFFAIKHDAQFDDKGELIKKEHYHVGIWFDSPIWLTTVLHEFNLDNEDAHLFKGLSDFKKKNGQRMFKTVNNYIDYTTHQSNENKPDKYTFDDFITNCPDKIYNALNDKDRDKHESLMALIDFIEKALKEDKNMTFAGVVGWYRLASKNGLGETFYSNWGKMRDILQDMGVKIGGVW